LQVVDLRQSPCIFPQAGLISVTVQLGTDRRSISDRPRGDYLLWCRSGRPGRSQSGDRGTRRKAFRMPAVSFIRAYRMTNCESLWTGTMPCLSQRAVNRRPVTQSTAWTSDYAAGANVWSIRRGCSRGCWECNARRSIRSASISDLARAQRHICALKKQIAERN